MIYSNDFESDTSVCGIDIPIIQGEQSTCLSKEVQFRVYSIELTPETAGADWVRATADFRCGNKEWATWYMAQMAVEFYDENNENIKSNMIRVYRFMDDGSTNTIFLDASFPKKEKVNKIKIQFWNAEGTKKLLIDNLKVETFDA